MSKHKETFLGLSSELTGYSPVDLLGTGLVDEYYQLLERELPHEVFELLYHSARAVLELKSGEHREHAMRVNIVASATLWPVCTSAEYLVKTANALLKGRG